MKKGKTAGVFLCFSVSQSLNKECGRQISGEGDGGSGEKNRPEAEHTKRGGRGTEGRARCVPTLFFFTRSPGARELAGLPLPYLWRRRLPGKTGRGYSIIFLDKLEVL